MLMLLVGCSTATMEFTSAKTYARSDKNLQKAEEWGIKALNMASDSTNALVPYFLATEIYKPQEKWEKMAFMLDEAERRNPEQKLEKPKLLVPPEELTKENYDEMVIETVGEGVKVYRDDAWGSIFNQAVELMEKKEDATALKKLNLCIKINPSRTETYAAIAQFYVAQQDIKTAKEYVEMGLKVNESVMLYETNAKLLLQNYQNTKNKNLLSEAERMYLNAMELTDDTSSLKKQLIFVYIDMGENQKAIDISNELLNIYYDDPDLYFNVGVLYQRLAQELYDSAANLYKEFNDGGNVNIQQMYSEFIQAMDYANQSKEKFLEANDFEIEDTGSREAASEMRKLVKQIKNIYIPSIEEMAKNEGVDLN